MKDWPSHVNSMYKDTMGTCLKRVYFRDIMVLDAIHENGDINTGIKFIVHPPATEVLGIKPVEIEYSHYPYNNRCFWRSLFAALCNRNKNIDSEQQIFHDKCSRPNASSEIKCQGLYLTTTVTLDRVCILT